MGVIARATDAPDRELVAAVRAGDDAAFEELYRRYNRRVAGYVCRMVGDVDRAEDITQEAFFSALRRLRTTDSEIIFKPWLFEIAKNASIDHFRRTSRAEEVSINPEDGGLRPADHLRLVGGGPGPDAAYEGKERLDNLAGAFDGLSESHSRILVLRELEGLSYREIGERMDMTRPAVESTLFRARRRLNEEYAQLDTGARCAAVGKALARLAEGVESARDRRVAGRHAARCSACRRQAREFGVTLDIPVRSRVAALLPLPAIAGRRRRGAHDGGSTAAGSYAPGMPGVAGTWAPAVVGTGAMEGTAGAWGKAAAVVAALIIAGGGAAIGERVADPDRPASADPPAIVAPDGGSHGAGDAGQPSGGAESGRPGQPGASGQAVPPADVPRPPASGLPPLAPGGQGPGLPAPGIQPLAVDPPAVTPPAPAAPNLEGLLPSVEPPPAGPPASFDVPVEPVDPGTKVAPDVPSVPSTEAIEIPPAARDALNRVPATPAPPDLELPPG